MKWPSFWEKRDLNSFVTFFPSFEWLSHCVCMQAGMWTRAACSGIRKLTGGGMAPCLCTLSVSEDHTVTNNARALFFLLLCLGRTHRMQPKTRVQKKSCRQHPGRVESWGCCLGLSGSCSAMEEADWLQIRDKPSSCAYSMGNSQRKSFWGVRDPRYAMVGILWHSFVCWLDWAVPLLCCFLVGSQDLCSRWVFLSWLKRQSCIAF